MTCKHNPINTLHPTTFKRITVCSHCGLNMTKDKFKKKAAWLKARTKYERSQK